MKKNFLLLLWMTLLPFAAFAADITVNLVNLQYEYGAPLPVAVTTDMFSVQGALPGEVTKEQVAAALDFNYLDGDNKNVGNHHYSLTTKANYNGADTPLEGHTIYLFGGGNDGLIKIVAKPIQATWFEPDGVLTFNGSEQTQAFKLAVGAPKNVTFEVTNNAETHAGNHEATITGTGNYGGVVQVGFAIGKYKLTLDNIANIGDKVFQGSSQKPTPTFTGIESPMEIVAADYEVTYPSEGQRAYIVPGTYDVKVAFTENGNYFADNDGNALVKQFTITPYDITKNDEYIEAGLKGITITPADAVTFDGLQHQDAPTIKFGNNVLGAHNYNITYTSTEDGAYINAKDGWKVTVTFKGNNFTHDALTSKVVINQKPLEDVMIADIADQTYDNGIAITPDLTVSFNNGEADVNLDAETDYTVEYTNNINAGTATATITAVEGKNYRGSAEKTFTIKPVTVYIKPVDQSKFYGQADPNFAQPTTAMYELVDGEGNAVEKAVLNGTVALGRKAGETVGNYDIYVKSYTVNLEVKDNYKPYNTYYIDDENLGSHTATFTINAQEAKLILKFKEGTRDTKVYGDPTPTYTKDDLEVVSGLAGSDTWETLKGLATFTPTLESELVHYDGNKVTATITGLSNYPNIEVQPLAFTVTKRKFGVKPSAQSKDYGAAISKAKTYWAKAAASTYAFEGTPEVEGKDDVLVELYTDEDVTTFAPGSVHEGVIKARIADESNYQLDEENSVWGTLTINAATQITLDRDDIDLATKITAFDGQDVVVKFANMTMRAKEWYAIVLPFATTPAELVKGLGQYVVCNVLNTTASTDQNYKFTLEMDELPAGVPFLIKPAQTLDWADFDLGMEEDANTDEPSAPVAVKKTIVSAITPAVAYLEDKELVKFTGTYANNEILGVPGKPSAEDATITGRVWWLSDKSYGSTPLNDWRKPKNNAHPLKAMEAYLIAGEGWTTYAPNFTVEDFDGQTTSIKTLGAESIHNMLTEGWYTLNGVKLQSAPTQKGVYINNGKKVVIR